jgi:hypothetical protein
MPTWHSLSTFHGAPPPVSPDPVFPSIANQTFVDVTSVGAQAHNTQWADAIPGGGLNPTYPNGAYAYYPWGETFNHVRVPPVADVAYGALVVFKKPTASPTPAQFATQWADLANWRYYHMPTICAADPLAAHMVSWGGARLDNYTAPRYIYGSANADNPPTGTTAMINNLVMVQVNARADWGSASSYRTMDLTTLPGITLANTGGQFAGWAQNGRMWFNPTLHKSPRGVCKMVLSVDLEPSMGTNYFQDPAHWHAMDMSSTTAGPTFGGNQGAVALGNHIYHVVLQAGNKIWRLNTAGPASSGGVVDFFGNADVAANIANWEGINPLAIHPLANGYLNGGVVNDPVTMAPRYVVFSPYQAGATFGSIGPSSGANPIALCFDTFNPAGASAGNVFTTLGNWRAFDTTQVVTGDSNQPFCRGYQGLIADNGGFGWLLCSEDTITGYQVPWLCWNPLYPFDDPRAWKSYPSYTGTWLDERFMVEKIVCGAGFDLQDNRIFPSAYVMAAVPGSGRRSIMSQITINVPANGPGVPAHP